MKKKPTMYQTFKTSIFATVSMKDAPPEPVVKVIDNHLVINDACCDLRPIKERYDPAVKAVSSSCVENILYAESFLTYCTLPRYLSNRINPKTAANIFTNPHNNRVNTAPLPHKTATFCQIS